MSLIVNIRGTNGSGKSSAVRALMQHLGKPTPFLFDDWPCFANSFRKSSKAASAQ